MADAYGLRHPASASCLGAALASCRPLPQQFLPVSATGSGRRCCTLAIDSGKNILYICVCRGLRAAPNAFSRIRPKPQDAAGQILVKKKVIDKSHKKRYILFINALKKSVHRFCHPESRGLLKTRYGPAVRCHFGAGAVNRKASRSRSCPTLPGHQGAQNVLRNLGGTAVCNLQPSHGTFRGTAFSSHFINFLGGYL